MKKYTSEAAYEWCGVCTKWQHHAESPAADFSHLSTKAVGEATERVLSLQPCPGLLPPALLAAQGGVWENQAGTAPQACHEPVLPSHTQLAVFSVLQLRHKTYGLPQLPASSGHSLNRICSGEQILQDEAGEARLMLMPDPPNPALPFSHFPIFRGGLHHAHPRIKNSISDPTKLTAPDAGIHLGQHTSPVVCPLI